MAKAHSFLQLLKEMKIDEGQARELVEALKTEGLLPIKLEEHIVLPDGSGAAIVSMALRPDHWIYESNTYPPMGMRIGTGEERDKLTEKIREAAKYAVRGTTMSGKSMDFDPDALVQNMIVGLLGYWTENGLSDDAIFNPPHTRN